MGEKGLSAPPLPRFTELFVTSKLFFATLFPNFFVQTELDIGQCEFFPDLLPFLF